jgi:hypothetical protein
MRFSLGCIRVGVWLSCVCIRYYVKAVISLENTQMSDTH